MPSRSWPLWILSVVLLLALPALSFIYWPLVLQSGVLPTEADSIGIPMFYDLFSAFILAPIVLGTAWLCLRRYNPDVRLAAWRWDRPTRTLLASMVLGGAAASLAVLLLMDAGSDWPWYEHLWTGYAVLWICWFLAMRAAVIEQLRTDRGA